MKTGPRQNTPGFGEAAREATEAFLEASSLGKHSRHSKCHHSVIKDTGEEGLTFCKARTHLGCWKLGTMGGKKMLRGLGVLRGLDRRMNCPPAPYRG